MLYLVVVLTGSAVMMIELLGTRIIGPFYGVSLFVWSSLISITLIALALGYFWGGYLADRSRRFRLSHALLLAAVSTAFIPLVSRPVLEITNSFGIRLGSFVCALLLFGAPLTFLAMASPFVIKLACVKQEQVGITAGLVYAVSTLGSVIGTLLLGFYLLPVLGSRIIIYSLSVVLWLLATGLALFEKQRLGESLKSGWLVLAAVVMAGILAGAVKAGARGDPHYKILFGAESVYGRIRVVDDSRRNFRWMLADSSTISGMEKTTGKTVLAYQKVVLKLPYFRPEAKDALLIGLGGGHLVKELVDRGIQTDVIEIDPVVVEAAKTFFGFRPAGQLWIGDARYQVRQLKGRYDFIIHDCFTGGSEPVHLLSREMLEELRNRLKQGGVLALNLVGFVSGRRSEAVVAVYRTLRAVFPHTLVLVAEPRENFNDIVFFASELPLVIDSPLGGYQALQWFSEHRFPLPKGDGWIVTDDYNPLESLQVGKAEAYRSLLLKRIGTDAFFW